jgi:hypothetical protein
MAGILLKNSPGIHLIDLKEFTIHFQASSRSKMDSPGNQSWFSGVLFSSITLIQYCSYWQPAISLFLPKP